MSTVYFFQLLGHVYLASHTADHDADVATALKGAGLSAARIEQGKTYADHGEHIFDRKLQESPDNKTQDHNTHSAASEVEMWLQTVKIKLRKAGFDAEARDAFLGHDLHAHKHLVTVIIQALRAIGMLRALDDEDIEALGGERVVRDLVMRGNTLTKRLYKTAEYYMTPSSVAPGTMPIFAEIDELLGQMSSWLQDLDVAATQIPGDLDTLGMVGYLPHGVGLPVGGAAFDVLTHHRAKITAPDPRRATATSGWSVGRQGNRENLGQGWIKPTYEN